MVNKKGWLRIAEAFIAIVIIAGVLLFVFTKNINKPSMEEQIYNIEKEILEGIADNAELRERVLNMEEREIEIFISENLPSNLGFYVRVCEIDNVCGLPNPAETYTNKAIYSKERIITSTLTEFEPKKIKLFVWEK